MSKDGLEKLRRELESFDGKYRHADSPELEYHLTRLTTALSGGALIGYRYFSPHQHCAELLAEIDALLAQTDAIRELAERVRDVLLRPPPEEHKASGFRE